jgi:hypothetical protein
MLKRIVVGLVLGCLCSSSSVVLAEKVGIVDCQTKWSPSDTWKRVVEMLGYEAEMVMPEQLVDREDISSYQVLITADTVLTKEEMSGLKDYIECR